MLTQKERDLQAKEFSARATRLGDSMLHMAKCIVEGKGFEGRSYRETVVLWYDTVSMLAVSKEYATRAEADVSSYMKAEIEYCGAASANKAESIMKAFAEEDAARSNPVRKMLRVVKGGKDRGKLGRLYPDRPAGA